MRSGAAGSFTGGVTRACSVTRAGISGSGATGAAALASCRGLSATSCVAAVKAEPSEWSAGPIGVAACKAMVTRRSAAHRRTISRAGKRARIPCSRKFPVEVNNLTMAG